MSEPSRHQIVHSERVFEAEDREVFSRIDFAIRVLDILRPDMDVTVYAARRRLQVRRGRDWKVGADAFWALVAIPPTASRYHVAFALAELVGKAQQAFVVDLVARAGALSRNLAD